MKLFFITILALFMTSQNLEAAQISPHQSELSDDLKNKDFNIMLKQINFFHSEVDKCSSLECYNKIAQEIISQFYNKNRKETLANFVTYEEAVVKANTTLYQSNFCYPSCGNLTEIDIQSASNKDLRNYLHRMLNHLAENIKRYL